MICGTCLDLLQNSDEYSCAVCPTGVGNNSIYCNDCKLWVHKKCSGLQWQAPNPDLRCAQCMGTARSVDGRPQNEVQVGPDKLQVVASFCYLGDMLPTGEGCVLAVTTCLKTAWKKFREFNYHFSHSSTSLTRQTCSAMTGPWSDRSALSRQRMWPQ